MMQRMIAMGSGGGGGTYFPFSITWTDINTATDANPYVIQGDFSKCDTFMAVGYYYQGSTYVNYKGGECIDFTFGTKYQVNMGTQSPSTSWRNITVYSDRIEIGQGGYATTNNSNYGILTDIIVYKDKQPT